MKAILTKAPGDSRVLEVKNVPDPEPQSDEVLIQVAASGVNGADLMQRRGFYPPPPGTSDIIGLEVSGKIVALGSAVDPQLWPLGTRVMALLSGGGYAEKVAVRSDQIMRVPESVELVAAGGISEVFLTAYLELIWLGKLTTGQKLLIQAGASGVGTAAIQIAKARGAKVWVTASSAEKIAFCQKLGADFGINYKTENFVEAVKNSTNGQGVDVILDLVGAANFPQNLSALATEGKLLLVGLGSGAKSEIDLRLVLGKRLQIIGSTLRSRSLNEKARLIAEFWQDGEGKFRSGAYRPVIDKVFHFSEAAKAHDYMESRANKGKILLQWP